MGLHIIDTIRMAIELRDIVQENMYIKMPPNTVTQHTHQNSNFSTHPEKHNPPPSKSPSSSRIEARYALTFSHSLSPISTPFPLLNNNLFSIFPFTPNPVTTCPLSLRFTTHTTWHSTISTTPPFPSHIKVILTKSVRCWEVLEVCWGIRSWQPVSSLHHNTASVLHAGHLGSSKATSIDLHH